MGNWRWSVYNTAHHKFDASQVPNDRLVADEQGHAIDQTMRDEVFKLIREWFTKQGVLGR
ncbi:MAG: hypothetical protein U1F71_06435 [Verrucomicrobiaceae bacterium]